MMRIGMLLLCCLAIAGCGITIIDLKERPAEGVIYRR